MIKQEFYDVGLVRTFSDQGYYIEQVETGEIFADAVDTVPLRFTYRETEERIEE